MVQVPVEGAAADDVDLRCAPWTKAQGVDPVGTAGEHDAFLLVSQPLPWPRDVSEMPALAAAAAVDPRVRVLAVAPEGGGAAGAVAITRWRREGANRFVGTDHLVDAHDVAAAALAMARAPDAAHSASHVGDAPAELLVCAHGRRDRCCGRWGTLLQTELAAALPGLCGLDDIRVRRCSHTGGHRFAPTGISLPDGRAWAYLDADVAAGVVAQQGDPRALRPHYRGSTAVPSWAQPVERALFEALGWAWLDHELVDVSVDLGPDPRADVPDAQPDDVPDDVPDDRRDDRPGERPDPVAEVRLSWRGPLGEGSVRAVVGVRRRVPTLVCGEPPEAATKTSPELEVRTISGLPALPGDAPRP